MGLTTWKNRYTNHDWLQDRLKQPFGDDCVEWPYGCFTQGYGQVSIQNKPHKVHRIACKQFHGKPTDERTMVLHGCDNPACFNPKHLRWGSNDENMADMVKRSRAARCMGEEHSGVKLTEKEVLTIRELRNSLGLTHQELADRFAVTRECVSRIIRRETWGHI